MDKYELYSLVVNIHNKIAETCDKHKLSARERLFIIKCLIDMLIENVYNFIDESI